MDKSPRELATRAMRAANSKCVYPESDSLGMNWFFPGEERDKPTQNARDDAFPGRRRLPNSKSTAGLREYFGSIS
jgi:hypothetical protein